MSVALALLAAGCDGGRAAADETRRIALNGDLLVPLPASPDPLSLTTRSLRVTDERGRVLAHRATCEGAAVLVRLEIDAALLADPPRQVRVGVAGGASLFGLLTEDGDVLPARHATFPMRGALADRPEGGLFLALDASTANDARDASAESTVIVPDASAWTLFLQGVVDPAHLPPDALPLFPLVGGTEWPAVHAPFRWLVIGDASEVVLDLRGLPDPLRFRSRRTSLRSLGGRALEPRVELTLRHASGRR